MSEETDYGYGDGQPDYGYGDGQPAGGTVDYGYGEATPTTIDYGYGDAKPTHDMDYSYGDGAPTTNPLEYGYGDSSPDSTAQPQQPDRRPKRRCSVTKYTLENEDKESPLTAHTRISDFRNGVVDDSKSIVEKPSNEEGESSNKEKKKGMMHRIRKRLSIVT